MQVLTLAVLAALTVQIHSKPKASPYTLVADAGSTGTRMYLFHLEGEAGSEKLDISDLGKGPALSSFQDRPDEAAATVKQQIEKAKTTIPAAIWKDVPVMVFATAGMRLVEHNKAQAVYAGLRAGVLSADFPFDRDAFVAKTITGREEGVYGFVAANYLSEHIGADLRIKGPYGQNTELMGVMDLGGSSTQIAVPPSVRAGDELLLSLGEGHMYVKSFLSLGMERTRKLTYERAVQQAHWAQRAGAKVPNPCAFVGLDDAGELWRGTGDAVQCQHVITAVLSNETDKCRKQKGSSSTCLPMQTKRGHHPKKSPFSKARAGHSSQRFFMISGYAYVTDFARWWLERPGTLPKHEETLNNEEKEILSLLGKGQTFASPTLKELRSAAAILCAGSWVDITSAASNPSTKHKFTSEKKAAHRCFELNYIICLLSAGYGFPEDTRPFQYVDAIGGRDVEWSLGAFLLSRSSQSSQLDIQEADIDTAAAFEFQGDHWMLAAIVPMVLLGIVCVFRRRSKDDCLGGDVGKQV